MSKTIRNIIKNINFFWKQKQMKIVKKMLAEAKNKIKNDDILL